MLQYNIQHIFTSAMNAQQQNISQQQSSTLTPTATERRQYLELGIPESMIDTTHAFTVTGKSAVSSTLPCANVTRTPPALKDKVNTKSNTDSSTDNASAKCQTTITESQTKLTTLDPRRLSPGSAPDIKYGTCSPAVPIFLNTPQVRNPPAWPPQPAFPACDATAEHYTARNISGDAAWPPGRPPSSEPVCKETDKSQYPEGIK